MIEMDSHFAAPPVTGELTCSADAMIEEPDTPDIQRLADSLDKIATRLGVDMLLEADLDD